MKIQDFKYQEKQKKTQMLFESGVYLCSRQEPKYIIDLYQLGSFYVEAYYHQRDEEVGYMRAFSSVEELDPYLQGIDLSSLL